MGTRCLKRISFGLVLEVCHRESGRRWVGGKRVGSRRIGRREVKGDGSGSGRRTRRRRRARERRVAKARRRSDGWEVRVLVSWLMESGWLLRWE